MDSPTAPMTPQVWERTMRSDGTAALVLSVRRPAFPASGAARRMERYFAGLALQWRERWETALFPRACQALAGAKETGGPFLPWRAELDYTVTLWRPPLLSLRLDAVETGPSPLPLRVCMGETWDCACGYPRTLRSFFPAGALRWRQTLMDDLRAQAEARLSSGESLLDSDCAQIMERTFDPERFYLTEEGLAVFYPLYVLGPYAEGIPVFSIPLPGGQSFNETGPPRCPEPPGGGTR